MSSVADHGESGIPASPEYGFFSRTTLRFTRQRIEFYGLRVALRYAWEDFQHNVLRGQPMWDHTLPNREGQS